MIDLYSRWPNEHDRARDPITLILAWLWDQLGGLTPRGWRWVIANPLMGRDQLLSDIRRMAEPEIEGREEFEEPESEKDKG